MKKWLATFILTVVLLFANHAKGQTYTQTFIDKCTGEKKIATTTYINGSAVVSFYGQIKTFSPFEIQTGALQIWLTQTYALYNSLACPVSQQSTAIIAQTAASAATQAASSAASAAASSAASTAASNAASSSASSAASSSASTASTSATSSSPPPTSSSSSSSSQSSSSSGSSSSSSSSSESGSSSTETKTESKQETKTEEKKTESKSEEKKEESKSEEKKEESKSEEKKEEKKKEDKKKEDKKKSGNINPMIFSADLSVAEQPPNRQVVPMMNMGISKSSMTGLSSFGANATVFLDLSKVAVGGSYTKSQVNSRGQLEALHNFGTTYFTDFGNHMIFPAYTYIQPIDKLITGYNISANTAFIQGGLTNISPSLISFAMYPITVGRKTITPDLFMIASPWAISLNSGVQTRNRDLTFLTGFATDFKITRKFKVNVNFKIMVSTANQSIPIRSFMIGSKLNL